LPSVSLNMSSERCSGGRLPSTQHRLDRGWVQASQGYLPANLCETKLREHASARGCPQARCLVRTDNENTHRGEPLCANRCSNSSVSRPPSVGPR
jgi:hypothetical protein